MGVRSLLRLLRDGKPPCGWMPAKTGREGPDASRRLTDWGGRWGRGVMDWGLCTSLLGDPESKFPPPLRHKETETMLISLSVEITAVAQCKE